MMFKALCIALVAAPLCQAGIAGLDINGSIQDALQSFDLPAQRFIIPKQGI